MINTLSLLQVTPEEGMWDLTIDGQRLPVCADNSYHLTRYSLYLRGLMGTLDTPVLDSGRVPLYTCSCCGDISCGGLAVRVGVENGIFTWSDFAWENDLQDAEPATEMADITLLRFTQPNYLKVLNALYKKRIDH